MLMKVRHTDCSKLAENRKNFDCVIICQHDVVAELFWRLCISFVWFGRRSTFHANIVAGPEVTTNFVYKRFDQESGKWENARLRRVQYLRTELGKRPKNWHGSASKVASFYRFLVIWWAPAGRTPLPQRALKNSFKFLLELLSFWSFASLPLVDI